MKHLILTSVAIFALAAAAALAQVDIPLGEPVTIQQPVTVTQNVTITSLPLTSIVFDLAGERIVFRAAGSSANLTISGAEYTAVKSAFLDPFAAAVAPSLRAKLSTPEE